MDKVTCAMCQEEREVKSPSDLQVYTCPECGEDGLDCCIAGNNCICFNCEHEE